MIEVVAALITEGEKFLICQRPANKARGLKWEFAGGKIEAGESPAEALERECREELGIEIKTGALFGKTVYGYPDVTISLSLYRAEIKYGSPELREHAALKWITADEIPDYQFCAADYKLLAEIKKKFSRSDGGRLKKLGKKGERKAARYLKRKGYKIVERNYRTPFCEIDIIAKRGDVFVFCEVKTRLNDRFGTPAEAVDNRKQSLYIKAAERYVPDGITARFDVIEVFGDKINHLENAFYGQSI